MLIYCERPRKKGVKKAPALKGAMKHSCTLPTIVFPPLGLGLFDINYKNSCITKNLVEYLYN